VHFSSSTLPARLALVRHGRSAHVHRGWIDSAGFRAWREAYEAAGLSDAEEVPPSLARLVDGAALVVASDAPRAVESARLLAPHRQVTSSPLLRELELTAPNLGPLRLPLAGWALAVGMRALLLELRARHPPPAELARVEAAVHWLSDLTDRQPFVVAITHASLRRRLAIHLARGGWQPHRPQRSLRHWSAWLFSPPTPLPRSHV
jgi:hypothetical protein